MGDNGWSSNKLEMKEITILHYTMKQYIIRNFSESHINKNDKAVPIISEHISTDTKQCPSPQNARRAQQRSVGELAANSAT